MRCETCLGAGRLSTYEGQTWENGYTRGKQNLDSLRLKDEKTHFGIIVLSSTMASWTNFQCIL